MGVGEEGVVDQLSCFTFPDNPSLPLELQESSPRNCLPGRKNNLPLAFIVS